MWDRVLTPIQVRRNHLPVNGSSSFDGVVEEDIESTSIMLGESEVRAFEVAMKTARLWLVCRLPDLEMVIDERAEALKFL